MSLKIITVPNPILRNKSTKIKKVDKEISQLILDMKETMYKGNGIGLAAPQIGKNIRLIVVGYEGGERKNGETVGVIPFYAIINPKITSQSREKEIAEEGCLSVPGVWGDVERNKKITVRYIDENGKEQKLKCRDLLARVIQHEIDHLDGILFIDKAVKVKRTAVNKNAE